MNKKRIGLTIAIMVITIMSIFLDLNALTLIPEDPTSVDGNPEPILGAIHLTVIPVFFPDLQQTLPLDNISSFIFGNISDYFFRESYGLVWLDGSVRNWIEMDYNRSYYSRGSLQSTIPETKSNASLGCKLFREEVKAKLIGIEANLTSHILLLYAGGSSVHPHHSVMSFNELDCETSIAPELYSWGTIAHEIAHGFGLHDLYNIDKENCWGTFLGGFDLMSSSGFNHGINGMCAYSKISLGWIQPNEILDTDTNTTIRLLRIEEWGEGIRVLRIPIDSWRYYLVEVQIYYPMPGLLISRIDRTRRIGGYGRIEGVRSARGMERIEQSLFTEYQQFIDEEMGLSIKITNAEDPFFDVDVRFTDAQMQYEITHPADIGDIHNVTSVVDHNGTTYFAMCATNTSTQLRNIHVFRFTDKLEYVAHSPFSNDTINPILVSGYDGVLLLYEALNPHRHSIVAQFNNTISIASGNDDARNPTAAFSGNGLFIAYENITDSHQSIVVRKCSSYSWNNGFFFQNVIESNIQTTENGYPHSPDLCPANNYAVLSYLWSGTIQTKLLLKWKINSPNITLNFDDVESFMVEPLNEYRIFISLTLSNGTTSVYFLKGLMDELIRVTTHQGKGIGIIPMLGLWEGYQEGHRLVLSRVWDRWYRQGPMIVFDTSNEITTKLEYCSIAGSTALALISLNSNRITITIIPVTSLSSGVERNLSEVFVPVSCKVLVSAIFCLIVFLRWDEKVKVRFNLINRSISSL